MGGLVGIVDLAQALDRDVLERMFGHVALRGPDARGEFLEGPAAFAHARKAFGEDRGVQPVVTDDHVLLLDGWIYDHEALGEHITGPAAPDATDSQTLLALNRYTLPIFGMGKEAYAMMMWQEDERLRLLAEYGEAADLTAAAGDEKRAEELRELLNDTLSREPLFLNPSRVPYRDARGQ